MPQFREKLADSPFNLDHPVWVDDNNFDVNRHLHRIGLPPPGGRAELAEICGHIASLPLDRSRPLWEMWVIEGVAGTDAQRGRSAGGDDQGAPRRCGRRDRRQPDVAAVQHRSRRARRRIRSTASAAATTSRSRWRVRSSSRPGRCSLANVLPDDRHRRWSRP